MRAGGDQGSRSGENTARKNAGINPEPFLLRKAKQSFYNTSPMDMKTLMGDQDHIKENLYAYIQAFSPIGSGHL